MVNFQCPSSSSSLYVTNQMQFIYWKKEKCSKWKYKSNIVPKMHSIQNKLFFVNYLQMLYMVQSRSPRHTLHRLRAFLISKNKPYWIRTYTICRHCPLHWVLGCQVGYVERGGGLTCRDRLDRSYGLSHSGHL